MLNMEKYSEYKQCLLQRINSTHEPSDELLLHLLEVQSLHIDAINDLRFENKILRICLAGVGVGVMLITLLNR